MSGHQNIDNPKLRKRENQLRALAGRYIPGKRLQSVSNTFSSISGKMRASPAF